MKITARSLSWIAFPRKVLPARRRDDRARAFAEVEANLFGHQDEYFEWHATRRPEDDKIVKVVFVTETPEYWRLPATTSDTTRARLVQLYQGARVPRRAGGGPVRGAADRGRRFRREGLRRAQPVEHHRRNCALHRRHQQRERRDRQPRPARRARVSPGRRVRGSGEQRADVGRRLHHARGRALVRNGYRVTVAEPVGLYIDGWDDTGWTKPDGSPVGDYWRITRGRPGAVLRLEYEVPDEEGFVVGDIRIGGRPVPHGGQLAEHMTSSLPVVVARRSS